MLDSIDQWTMALHLLLSLALVTTMTCRAKRRQQQQQKRLSTRQGGNSRTSQSGEQGGNESQQGVPDEVFLADRQGDSAWVGLSLLSGLVSAISFLGLPGYVYKSGAAVILIVFGVLFGGLLVAFVILPIFSNLQLTTSYTYLEMRFSRGFRTFASLMFVLRVCCYGAVVLQGASLAVLTMLGLQQWIFILCMALLATSYTIAGGMAAVIYSDAAQSVGLLCGAVAVIASALAASNRGKGLSLAELFHVDPEDLFAPSECCLEDNLYFFILGSSASYAAQAGTDQIAVQRLLSTPSVKAARKSMLLGISLGCVCNVLLVACGVALRYYFHSMSIDPFKPHAGIEGITTADELIPYYLSHFAPRGAAGIVAGAILGCTLSVLAGALNSAATCVFIDLGLQPVVISRIHRGEGGQGGTEGRGRAQGGGRVRCAIHGLTAFFGCLMAGMGCGLTAFSSKGLVVLSNTSLGLTTGLVFGVFLAGMLVRRANWQGACIGLCTGGALSLLLAYSAFACNGTTEGSGLCRLQCVSGYTFCCIALASLAFPAPGAEQLGELCRHCSSTAALQCAASLTVFRAKACADCGKNMDFEFMLAHDEDPYGNTAVLGDSSLKRDHGPSTFVLHPPHAEHSGDSAVSELLSGRPRSIAV